MRHLHCYYGFYCFITNTEHLKSAICFSCVNCMSDGCLAAYAYENEISFTFSSLKFFYIKFTTSQHVALAEYFIYLAVVQQQTVALKLKLQFRFCQQLCMLTSSISKTRMLAVYFCCRNFMSHICLLASSNFSIKIEAIADSFMLINFMNI